LDVDNCINMLHRGLRLLYIRPQKIMIMTSSHLTERQHRNKSFPFFSLYTTDLLLAREELLTEHFGMGVHTGVDTHSLNSADHLGHLALVDGSKTGEVGVVDHSRRGCEVFDEREVL
jgi:hypothetical protein